MIDLDRTRHRAFLAGIVFKGLDGCLELVGGIGLLLTTRPMIEHMVARLTRASLLDEPDSQLANHALLMAQQLSESTRHFAAFYLLARGAIKVALVGGLLRGLRWSYPTALAVLAGFVLYQAYRLYRMPSWPLALLTALDLAVMLLIWLEWVHARRAGLAGAAR